MLRTVLLSVPWLLAGLAHAEVAVIPFGTLDVTMESVHADALPRQSRISSNSSGFGVKGSEPLGGGNQALFQIEGGYNVDTGVGGVNTRDTFVGLSGPAGLLRLGFMSTPMRALGGRVNFVPGGTSIANNIGVMTTLNGLHAGLNSRLGNAIQYSLPTLAGATGALLYAPGETRPGGYSDHTWGAGITADWAPWYVGWAWEDRRAQQKLALGDSHDWERRAVVRYHWTSWTLNLGWDRLGSRGLYTNGLGSGAGEVRRTAWTAGLMARRGPHDAMLHYTVARPVDCAGRATTGQCAPAAIGATGAWQVSMLYHYIFSKRTMLIAFYTKISNRNQARYDWDANPMEPVLGARLPGADPAGIGCGLRHSY